MIRASAVTSALETVLGRLGGIERINKHEPKNAPGNGITAALWPISKGPARGASGLDSTTLLCVMRCRLFRDGMAEPLDMIETDMMDAADDICEAMSAHFTLAGLAREVDLLGAFGNPLGWVTGWANVSGTHFRIIDVTIPLILNDQYDQEA